MRDRDEGEKQRKREGDTLGREGEMKGRNRGRDRKTLGREREMKV